jgi:Ca2+-binding RTX toxin-like protein
MQIYQFGLRRALAVAATGAFLAGLGALNGGGAQAVGGLCNGRSATRPWLDASAQAGPALIDGTKGNDVIIGSQGDDTIDGRGGNDTVCGGPGNDSISVGPGGNSVVRGDSGDDDLSADNVHSVTISGDVGNDTIELTDTAATSYLVGGIGDDLIIHDGSGPVKIDGGPGFDDCLARSGDEVVNCEE